MYGKSGIVGLRASYPYLEAEDADFAVGWRLSEDEALGLFGGLAKYVQHRLDRKEMRAKGYEIPPLSARIEDHMEGLKFTAVTPAQFAASLASDHTDKVLGCIHAEKANKHFRDEATREAKIRANQKDEALKALRHEASIKYGWGEDSQSAKDYAEQQFKLSNPGR